MKRGCGELRKYKNSSRLAGILNRSAGFTLVEVMMTVLIFSMVMGGLYTGLIAGSRTWQVYDIKSATQREARKAVSYLSRDLRMAKNLSFSAHGQAEIIFSFRHPVEGPVKYSWSAAGGQSGKIFRESAQRPSRIIADNITEFSIEESQKDISYAVTATAVLPDKRYDTFRLSSKVSKR